VSLTADVASAAAGLQFEDLPEDVVEVATQCVLDWLGVTLAGSSEPAAALLLEELAPGSSTVVGRPERLALLDAALVNGTASHALDYDDVNDAMLGHPSVPILGALLALGESLGSSGRDVLTAFVAGYEAECAVGRAVGPAHYQRGFHATGTVGTFGAAAACARLLGLSPAVTAVGLGIAGTQAAGLKSMFGTMCKPLHAGAAGRNGLLAARLAARGYTAAPDVLEVSQGFAETHTDGFDAGRVRRDGWHLRSNLFKYHAACFQTQSAIEGLRRLRDEHRFSAADVASVVVAADGMQARMCAIPAPVTGLEAKFSLRHTAAMVLAGMDTSAIGSFSDSVVADPAVLAVRERVEVTTSRVGGSATPVTVRLADGRVLEAAHDLFVPETDLARQRRLLEAKFAALAGPVLGASRAEALATAAAGLADVDDIGTLLAATRPSSRSLSHRPPVRG
jgi:2-methylcitrate dehydratase PrpD